MAGPVVEALGFGADQPGVLGDDARQGVLAEVEVLIPLRPHKRDALLRSALPPPLPRPLLIVLEQRSALRLFAECLGDDPQIVFEVLRPAVRLDHLGDARQLLFELRLSTLVRQDEVGFELGDLLEVGVRSFPDDFDRIEVEVRTELALEEVGDPAAVRRRGHGDRHAHRHDPQSQAVVEVAGRGRDDAARCPVLPRRGGGLRRGRTAARAGGEEERGSESGHPSEEGTTGGHGRADGIRRDCHIGEPTLTIRVDFSASRQQSPFAITATAP